jgi:hypothetical protein
MPVANLFLARRPGVSKSAIESHNAYTDEEAEIFQKSSPWCFFEPNIQK